MVFLLVVLLSALRLFLSFVRTQVCFRKRSSFYNRIGKILNFSKCGVFYLIQSSQAVSFCCSVSVVTRQEPNGARSFMSLGLSASLKSSEVTTGLHSHINHCKLLTDICSICSTRNCLPPKTYAHPKNN